MKLDRHQLILEIIAQEEIETQNQLLEALQRRGVECTQATASRDIRKLRLVKEPGRNGGYHYVAPSDQSARDVLRHSERLATILREGAVNVDTAGNLVVMKTLPGLASAAASAVDSMEIEELVGSIAGDDTIFFAMKESAAAERFCKELEELL